MSGNNANRSPIRRQGAEGLLLLTLLSFALSVSLTRLFLELTGYPQLGGGGLHIAHVLWGGLLLFVAALIPLILANRWALSLSAILAGVGVGLFIDEVGKFITSTNDYFYPTAAPIIYAFFLLTVLVYLNVRKQRLMNPRAEFYTILDGLEEIIDRDLSKEEREQLITRLDQIIFSGSDPDIVKLAISLKDFLNSSDLSLVPHRPDFWTRQLNRYNRFEKRWLSRSRFHRLLIIGSVAVGLWMLTSPVIILLFSQTPGELQNFANAILSNQLARNQTGLTWLEVRIGLEGSVGILLLLCAFLLTFRRERIAVTIGTFGLLFSLTVVSLLVFYFDQFSSIINATIQFTLLVTLLRYRNLFVS